VSVQGKPLAYWRCPMASPRTEYRTVSDVHTPQGRKQAEQLLAAGWQVFRPGMFTVVLRKTAR
jgi:hypothetical protein